eukprot:TRINITY_DN4885_c0_g4_i1.p1 TRINITY_DN4885_c0_g4~~TRINITY_DN4885_c0_g4_i1.p1  ORF type:complete len:253 (+),score=56.04 TRINITY_DN4885_c0_g4_i1:128-886(+)
MAQDFFSNVPKEILEIIFSNCEVDDLGKLSSRCKRINRLIEQEERWKERCIRLWNGVCDHPFSVLIWAKETSNTMSWKEIMICLWRKDKENGWSSRKENPFSGMYFGKFHDGKKISDAKSFEISTFPHVQVCFGEFTATGSGEGKRICKDGDYSKGTFKGWSLEGFGEQKRSDRIYKGEFNNRQRNGFGVATWNDGSRYEGQWKDDQRHGEGKMEWTGGLFYEGKWHKDKPMGPVINTKEEIHPGVKECIDK